jgi:hypothetical protein
MRDPVSGRDDWILALINPTRSSHLSETWRSTVGHDPWPNEKHRLSTAALQAAHPSEIQAVAGLWVDWLFSQMNSRGEGSSRRPETCSLAHPIGRQRDDQIATVVPGEAAVRRRRQSQGAERCDGVALWCCTVRTVVREEHAPHAVGLCGRPVIEQVVAASGVRSSRRLRMHIARWNERSQLQWVIATVDGIQHTGSSGSLSTLFHLVMVLAATF